ncbi:MAG: ABC transporter permease [Geodermatophilaceae bacterium]
MTLVSQPDLQLRAAAPPRRSSARRLLSLIVLGFVALSLLRFTFDAGDLTSSGAVRAALVLAIPIGLAGLGGLWSERAGIVNIGLEGMLIAGTIFGAWAGYQWGPWVGVLVGMAGGAVFGLVHAIATVSFAVDHIVSGVAINILAVGVGGVMGQVFFGDIPGVSQRQSPRVPDAATFSIPGVSDALRAVEDKGILILSDLAGVLGGLVTGTSVLTVLAVLLVPASYLVLWRTSFGLRLRSCGENPAAAESLGVNVYLTKYVAVIVSGGLAGLGGAYLVTVASEGYLEGQTGGRGFIGLAAMIFGNWRPGGLAGGALLFGYADALRLRGGAQAVPALLVFVTVGMVLLAGRELVRSARRRDGGFLARLAPSGLWIAGLLLFGLGLGLGVAMFDGWGTVAAVGLGIVGLLALGAIGIRLNRAIKGGNLTLYIVSSVVLIVWSASGVGIPGQFVTYMAYIVTLLVLAFATQRLRMPAADGLPYRKGQGT